MLVGWVKVVLNGFMFPFSNRYCNADHYPALMPAIVDFEGILICPLQYPWHIFIASILNQSDAYHRN